MVENKVENLRDQINKLDDELLDILDRRSKVVTEIGKHKDRTKGIVDNNREQEILDRLLNLTKGNYSKDTIIRIWRELFEASSKLQTIIDSPISTKRSIQNIDIYKGGKSSIKGTGNVIKLSSNESPFGHSSKISFSEFSQLNRYPEISGETLRKNISKFHNLNSEQIVLGCGSDETLLFAALSFCKPGDEIIHAEHGFEMYPIIAKIVGAVSKLAKEKDYQVSVESICEQLTPATKLIYIANPNNPTGTYLSKKEIRELMKIIPKNVILVLDCAYAEYVLQENYDSDFSLVNEYENIIITRTFSKAYGLAGIRLGWCYSSKNVASIISKVKGPFNTNVFAQQIAIEALQDQQHLKYVVAENKKNMEWFIQKLVELGLKFLPSFANFVFIECTNSKTDKIFDELLKNGIIVRQLNSYNLPNCIRITIGTMDEMKKVVSVLEDL